MKKILRTLLCAALLVTALSVSAFAAEREVPELQGDFYVLVNGQYVTFADAVPQLKDGRSFLPFVAVFDQLGFAEEDMTWDAATATVTAEKEGVAISLTEGSTTITVSRGEEVTTYEVDVAPYIDAATSRTYIPFGLAAEVLGYNVGWDAQTGTVIIDDVDAILAANTETYELMDKYLDYVRPFTQENQRITGSYAMEMEQIQELEVQGQPMEMSAAYGFQGDYEMLMAGSEVQCEMALDTSVSLSIDEEQAGSILPETIEVELRGDLEEGYFYVKNPLFNESLELPTEADLSEMWVRQSAEEAVAAYLMNFDDVMWSLNLAESDLTIEQFLETTLRNLEPVSVNYTAIDCLAEFNWMYADSAFTRSGSSYVNTFEQGEGDSGGDVSLETGWTLTLYTNGSRVNGYALEQSDGFAMVGAEFSIQSASTLRGDQWEATEEYILKENGTVTTITVTMDGVYQSTTAQPETEPPAGALIMDITEQEETASA